MYFSQSNRSVFVAFIISCVVVAALTLRLPAVQAAAPVLEEPIKAGWEKGDRVKAVQLLKVRNGACSIGRSYAQRAGRLGTVVDGPAKGCDQTWIKIDFDAGFDGWVIQETVMEVASTTAVASDFMADAQAGFASVFYYVTSMFSGGWW